MPERCFCGEAVIDPPCTCPKLKEAQHLILGYKYLLRRARREIPSTSPLRAAIEELVKRGEKG